MATVDELLGPEPAKPTVEQLLGPDAARLANPGPSGPVIDNYFSDSTTGHILNAFGQGVREGWGTGDLGFSPETEAGLQRSGIFNDVKTGQTSLVKSINEAFMRPLAAGIDAAMRAGSAAFRGAQLAVTEAGAQAGAPELGRDIAAMPEAFFGMPGGLGPRAPEIPRPLTGADIAAAYENRVIGGTEADWKGTGTRPAVNDNVVRDAVTEDRGAAPEEKPLAPPAEPAGPKIPADVHIAARQIAPEVFREYDTLSVHSDNLRDRIAAESERLRAEAEAQAPHADEITDIQRRMEDTTPRLAKKYQARLDELIPERDAFLADQFTMGALTRDTPELAAMRQQLLETDYRMRDLAPDVTAAYREAATRVPAVEEVPGVLPAPPPEVAPEPVQAAREAVAPTEPVGQVPPVVAQAPNVVAPVPPSALPADLRPPTPVLSIANDVARQLVSAGRPIEEANAAGQLIQAHYEARAERFGGAKGSAAEMYRRDAPEVQGQPAPVAPEPRPTIRPISTIMAENKLGPKAAERVQQQEMVALSDWQARQKGPVAKAGAAVEEPGDATALADRLGVTNLIRQLTKTDAKPEEISAAIGGKLTADQVRAVQEDIRTPELAQPKTLEQSPRGKIRLENGRAIITLMKDANASTFLHETGHAWLEELMRDATDDLAPQDLRDDAATVRKWLVAPEGDIPRRAHEKFARGFERYMMEGVAPTRGLARVFAQFKDWLTRIYTTVKALNAPITADIRDVFDRLLTTQVERNALAAESPGAAVANIHEADAQTVPPEAAAEVADRVATEAATTAKRVDPEIQNDLDRARADAESRARTAGGEAGGSASGGAADHGTANAPGPAPRETGAAGKPPEVSESGNSAQRQGAGTRATPDINEPFRPDAGDLIDKAGNIRLDNLNRPEDVKQALRDLAEQNNDFLASRGGPISISQRSVMADALGLTVDNFEPRKPEGVSSSVWADAVQKLTIQANDAAVAAGRLFGESGTEADGAAYLQAKQRLLLVANHFANVTAEAGRTLKVFDKRDMQFVTNVTDFLQAQTGRTLFQMQKEAKALGLMPDRGKAAKFVRDSVKPSFGDMALEYWINGLISGPATHTTYAVSNELLAVWKAVPETAMEAALGSIRAAAGDTGPRVYWGEVGAQLHGLLNGQRNGFRAAWKAAQTGLTTELPGETGAGAQAALAGLQAGPTGAIPGALGVAARLPSRGVAAIHSYSRTIGYSQGIARLAYRAAMDAGLTGEEFAERVARLTTNPPEAMMAEARKAATTQTLMDQGGPLTRRVATLMASRVNLPGMGSTQVLKFIDPFVRIGANIMNQALLERSPLGLLDKGIRDNLMGRNGDIARDQQIARIAVGSALGAVTIGMALQGNITGGGPSDPKERAAWLLTGKQPYSVRIGGTWYNFHRLGPLAMVIGVAADMVEIAHDMEEKDISHLGTLITTSLAKNLLDESFMRGPAELIQAIDESDRYGARYVRNFLSSWVPYSVGMAQMARAADPYARQARTIIDAFKAKVPWLSETLLPRRDVWGEPVPNKAALGVSGLSAIYESKVSNDPVNIAINRLPPALGAMPGPLERKIRGVPLTDQQYDDFARIAGRTAKQRLDGIVATPGFSSLPEGMQANTIRETVANARETARTMIMMQYPDIIRQALAAKQRLLH